MGLLDFLKKKKPSLAPKRARWRQAAEPLTEAGADVATSPIADEAGPPAAELLAAQPQQVTVVPDDGTAPGTRVADAPATVRAFDEFGRQVEIPLAAWRDMMLAEVDKAQDEPERLYGVIVQALEFRLAHDVLPAAQRLQAIDTNAERGAVMLGIVRMETGDAAGAARLYAGYLQDQEQRGEAPSATVLLNHAKALAALGDTAASDAMLWQSIEADPNQENGLGWFGALARERGGDEGYRAAMQRVAALPGAWRPQMSLARLALDRNDVNTAKALYAEALARAGKPAPSMLLQSMSGDLGNHGDLEEALALTRPAYNAAVHGLAVGNNLIKASLDVGRLEDARALVEELQRLRRPEWAGTLQFWEMQVKRAMLAKEQPLAEAQPEVTGLAIEGPVWLPAGSPARALFSPARGAKLLFLAASVSYAEQPEALQGMLPDAQGRLSRALPLFLAESAFLHMGLDATAIIPWVKGHGFAVMGAEWTDADAREYARSAGAVAAVALHLQQTGERTEARMRIVPAASSGEVGGGYAAVVPVDWTHTEAAALQLWAPMAHALLQIAGGGGAEPVDAARYVIPTGTALGNYLLRLEQLLAVRCAGSEEPGRSFLSGEREIVRGQLDLALSMPQSLPLRLILHETLLRMRDLRPEIAAEFREAVELLQTRYPMGDAEANAVLERQVRTVYPG